MEPLQADITLAALHHPYVCKKCYVTATVKMFVFMVVHKDILNPIPRSLIIMMVKRYWYFLIITQGSEVPCY